MENILAPQTLVEIIIKQKDIKDKGITFIGAANKGDFLSYHQLYLTALSWLKYLQDKGLKPGDELVFQIEDSQTFIELFWACILGAIIPVPVAMAHHGENVQKLFNIKTFLNNPTLFISRAQYKKLRAMIHSDTATDKLIFDKILFVEEAKEHTGVGIIHPVTPDAIAFLQFSSGSTGNPKGVVLTHHNLITNIYAATSAHQCGEQDSYLSWMPLTHDMGLIGFHLFPIGAGVNQYLIPTDLFIRNPLLWMQKVSEYRATITCSPNFGYKYYLNQFTEEKGKGLDLSSVKIILNGAEPVSASLCRTFIDTLGKFHLHPRTMCAGYGLAEASLEVTFAGIHMPLRTIMLRRDAMTIGCAIPEEAIQGNSTDYAEVVNLGYVIDGVTVKITDEKEKELKDGHIGIIWIKGDAVTSSYYNNETATKAVIKKDGWLNTGDTGFMRGGCLHVIGRVKDIIFVNGANVYPHDVEQTLEQLDGIETGKVVVCGVPDEETGSEGIAVFVLYKSSVQKFQPVITEIKRFIAAKFGLEVKHVLPVRKIHKTTSGKVKRFFFVEEYRKGTYNEVILEIAELNNMVISKNGPVLSDKDNATGFHNAEVIRQWLQQWLQQRLHLTVADLDTQHTFASYGMTSLLAVTLAVDLEAWLQVTIDNTAVYNFPTIDTLAAHLSGISTDSSRKKQHIVSQVTDNRIAVIGIGCRFPGGISTPAAFWKLLREQRSAITVIPQDRWNVDDYFSPDMDAPGKMYTRYGGFIEQVDQFDPSFFGVSPKEADWMDPQQRLLLEVCWEALENAKLRPSDLRGSNSGVFIGVGTDDYQHLVHNSVDVSQLENAFNILGIERSIAAGRIAYMLDFHGPVVQLDTACSSSLLSVHQACQNILLGECSLALAGGVNLMLSPDTTIRLCRMKALSPSGLCKTFDDNADGYVRGEGCGVVVLKRFSDALADGDNILATITGSAANHDGLSNGLTAPNGIAQQHVIEKALANAGISADKVQYVEAHGTGTPLGDPVEVLALNNVYGRLHTAEQRLLIGAVKTNIGHLEAAAGIAGFIKTVLCLQHQQIPASLHYQHPNHFIPWNDMMIKVADQLTEWQPSTEKRMAAVSAFGLSGTNVHVILEEGIIDKNRAGIEARTLPSYPLLLSAKTPAALQATAEQYIALAVQSTTALEDIAYSSIITRDVFEYRLAVEVTSRHDIYQYLHAFINNTDDSRVLKGSLSAPKGKLVWLFTGQGAQYWKMGQELYENSLVFRGVMDHCDAFLEKCWGFSLTTLLYEKDKEEGNALLNQTAFAQPALFAISCALAALWQSWGIYPDIVAGHSVGEYAAAYVAGVFSLDDGLRLVTERGRLMQALDTPGAMSIVYAPVALVAEVIHPHAGELSIAAVNAPELTVVSGNKNTLNNVLSALGKSGVKSRKLVVSHAFHSPLMQPVLEEFSEIAASIRYQQPSIDFVSNVTGKVVTTEIANGDYWCRHIMSPVYFSESIKAIKQLNGEVLMELGPQPHLLSMAQLTWAIEDDNLFPAMQQGKSSWSTMLQSIMKLHVKGIAVNWENFYADHTHCKVPLPNYPFQRQHYWITAGNRVPYRPALPGKETVIPDNIGDSTLATKNSRTVILTYLSNLLGKSLKIPPAEINIHADFMLLGTDSLILSSMIRSVEKEYKIKLSVRQLFDQLITLDLLAGYIEANVPPGFFAETAPQASESPDSELTAVKAIEALSASIQNQFLALQQQLVDMLGQQFQLLSGQLKAGHVIKDNQEVSLPDQPIVQRNSQPVKPLHIPLSFNQESLWFIDQLYGGSIQYNVPMVLRLDGSLDPTALSFALQNIVHRHEVLRTVIRQEEDLAYQFVLDKDHWQLITIDNDLLKEDPQELKAYISTLIHTPFDLSEDYMLRAHLIRLSEAAHILVVMTHHIASDGWSAEIILREMVELYTAFVEKRPAQTPPLPMQYSDYALRQRAYLSEERLSEAIAYWKNQLAGVTTLQLPTDYTRPAVQGLSGADKRFRLDQELSDQLMVLSREQGTTLFMTLLTTFKVLLYHYSGQEDICVGSPMAGRMEEEVEGLVGFFVNTLVLRSDLGNNPSFTSLLQQVKQTTLAAYEHQEAPFEKVVEAVVKNRMQDRNPLYQVVFRAEKRPDISAFSLGSVQLSREIIDYTVAKFDMVFVVSEGAEGINVIVEYRKDLFKEDTIARFCGHFEQLLSAVTTAPETKIGALKILTEQERYQLLEDFAPARLSFSSTNKTILDLFEEQVSHSPDNIAVMFEGTKLTYRELDGRSNQLARHLVRLGVKPDCPVPICMERSADLITGILGIMKAGGAYVPVDPDYPAVRIAWVLEDTIATVVVSTTASASKIPGGNGFVKVLIDEDWPVISQEKDSNFTGIATADHLAYIIYTSGSTGNPKGVMITHRNLIDYLSGLKEYLDIAACRSFALVSGVSTDLGNTVIYSSLSAGGALHLFSKTTVNDINLLQQYFIREQIDCLKIVPSHWKALAADEKLLIPARLLIFGGDVLPAYFISLIRKNGGTCKIVNHYGPTETTIGKLMYEVTDDSIHETGIIPLGRPFSNTQVYILNHNMELCPVGVAGELYISGDGLARGYWNNQLLTEQKFITHSFDGINKTRLYRTGDLVKYLPDGNIVFISRIDTQVKLRGYRIEMGEIEDVLRRCGFVSQAVVMIKGEEENRKLVGYVVAEGNFDREGIYAHLKERLPEYMLPTQIVELENFPLTSNGKIDRKALPDPDISVQHTRTYVAPRNIVEKALADIWEELLETQEVGIHDDFFELGGHSLLAIRLISAIRKKLGIEITIGDIFDYPTISSLMARIGLHVDKNTAPAIMPGNRPAIIPLSFSQERLWFIDQMEGSTQYHTLVTFRLKGNLNREGLAHALQTIVNRHEVLRTVIEEKDGIAFQRVLEKDHWQLILKDDTIYKKDKKALQSYVQSLITIPFDLSADHMLRAYLFLLDEKEYLLAFTMHHIASDGWSISIIIRELVELYNATVEGRIAKLPVLPLQYADYAVWQRTNMQGDVLDKKISYWKDKLSGVASLHLPVDYTRPAVQSTRGADRKFFLDQELSAQLHTLSHQQGTTLFMTLLTAFNVLVHRYSGEDDICVGSPIAGRTLQEIEGLIGFFVNTLALRSDLKDDPTFISLLHQVKHTTLEAYEHQDVPFEKVVEVVVKERDLSKTPLFQVIFELHNTPDVPELRLNNLHLIREETGQVSTLSDLIFSIRESTGGLSGNVIFCTDLFRLETIDRMIIHFEQLLRAIVKAPNDRISTFNMLAPAEVQQLLVDFNNTVVTNTKQANETLISLFVAQAARTPDAIALKFEEQQLTYETLDKRSNQLAHYLCSKGITAETLVPVCLERSPEMIIGILGILKAGGAYVPIDPDYPEERIGFILEDTGALIVLSSSACLASVPLTIPIVILLDKDWEIIDNYPSMAPKVSLTATQLAYVIYTSGSTGTPKGVLIEHSSVVNLVLSQRNALRLKEGTSSLQFASLGFDASCYEIFNTLMSGGVLVLPGKEDLLSEESFGAFVEKHRVEVVTLPPSYLHIIKNVLGPVTTVVSAGEALNREDARYIMSKSIRLVNAYGPTENTVCTSLTDQPLRENNVVVIGTPIENVQIYICNIHGNLCPIGVVGEICVGGAGVARGYLDRTELTAEKFVPDPYRKEWGGRLYKTGDLGRWLPDGNIEYLGRMDDQVKIRGFRIELGEIETVLQACALVRQAVVLIQTDSTGDKQLVGYIVPSGTFNRDGIFDYLKEKLPEYMIPSLLSELEELPLTANGKIDKKALSEPDASSMLTSGYVAPRNMIEQTLVTIWEELLGLQRVGINDNFFRSGGHSLLAIRFVSMLRSKLQIEIAVNLLFQYATIASLAVYLKERERGLLLPGIEAVTRPLNIPLSYSQERLWFIDQLEGSVQYHISAAFKLMGISHINVLEDCLQTIINRHEVLRTVITQEQGQAYQRVQEKDLWKLMIVDDITLETDPNALQTYISNLIFTPFDLSKDHMIRVHLIRFSENEHIMVITIHHIVGDAWTLPILIKEIMELYAAGVEGRSATLAPLPIQYADYAIWQRAYLSGQVLNKQLAYWEEKLAGLEPLNLPTDYMRPAIQSIRGAKKSFRLSRDLCNQWQIFADEQNATLFMTLLAAFKVLLYRYSGQEDICVGTSIAGRTHEETEGLIGFFVNTLALRSDLSNAPSFITLLQQVKQTTLYAYEYQDVPFEKVVEVVEKERDMSRTSLFQVMFELFNTPKASELKLGELHLSKLPIEHITTLFDLSFCFEEDEDGLNGYVEYCIDLFSADTITRMIAHYEQLLWSILRSPEIPVSSLSMFSAQEKEQLLIAFNDTVVDYPRSNTFIDLFQAQAARTPDAVAVVFEDTCITYKELDNRSNQMSRYFSSKGVKAESLVPVCLQRSLDMIIAIMGIMKAGGAYVPIDPAYPAERIIYILEDCNASILVTNSELKQKMPVWAGIEILVAESNTVMTADLPVTPLPATISPDNLAYVIYTSGSTGQPKGAMIEHGGMLNHLFAKINDLKVNDSTILAYTASYTFDISIWQMFASLLCGGHCIIYGTDLITDPLNLIREIDKDQVTILELVPSYLAAVLQEEPEVTLRSLEYLLVTGEVIHQPLLAQWFRHPAYGSIPVVNAYGPTEASDDICHYFMYETPARTNIPLGKPIQNLNIYILDNSQRLCPVGVAGEICVSGVGVGRGYLNRPGLTAEKFIEDPYNTVSSTRMYRTGDLGRWLPDGNIECLGRIDDQVKVRGYRIELGEIESALQQSELVNQAVVLVKAEANTKRLLSYYVPDHQAVKLREQELYLQQAENWQELWETEYNRTVEEGTSQEEFNLTGWNDTFTGKAIPEDDMRKWLDDIVNVILSEKPERVLEIGCGAGLIYYQLAGHIKKYIGTDFSSVSVSQIRNRISQGEKEYPHTILRVAAAHEVTLDEDEVVDLVILNSVIQYFPGEQYLTGVLEKSISCLKNGGRIVIGDVRDNRLLKSLKSRLSIDKFQERAGKREFVWGVDMQLLKEEELCFSPEYFYNLKNRYPEITHVDIQLKKGDYVNELTLYRYTVVIYVGVVKPVMTPSWQPWNLLTDLQKTMVQLNNGAPVVALQDVPNTRLWKEIQLEHGLKDSAIITVGDLSKYIENPDSNMVAMNELLLLAQDKGYHCRFLLDEDPLKINLLLEQAPFPGFISSVYGNNDDLRTATTNIPLYGDICELLEQDIRNNLLKQLPEYMVPSEFVPLHYLPLTANGKIDRKFLNHREDIHRKSVINYQAPVTAMEIQLANIWQVLLGTDRIGIHDNFFESGGHSLLATRVVSAIRKELKVELTVKDFFLYPTITLLAAYIRKTDKGLLLPAIETGPRPLNIPLSYSQERLWFIDQLEGSMQYHIPAILKLKGRLNIAALTNALQTIINRHEVLRTVIIAEDGIAYQQVKNKDEWELMIADDLSYREDQGALQSYIQSLIATPFDLSADHMLRAHLIVLDKDEYVLIVIMHHIASDGWSANIIVKELVELYSAFIEARQAELPALSVQYSDYAIWQRTYLSADILTKKLDYWKHTLKDVSTLQLPLDYTRTPGQRTNGAGIRLVLDKELYEQLRLLGHQQHTTLFMTLLAAFKVLLYRYCNQTDICVGTSTAVRQPQEVENLVGFFVNTLALRSDVSNHPSFISLLQQVKATTLNAYEHEDVPFEKVVEAIVKNRDPGKSPLFQVMFAMQHAADAPELHLGELVLSKEIVDIQTAKFDITFFLVENKNGLQIEIVYGSDLFREETIVRMADHYVQLLRSAVKEPSQQIDLLPMLTQDEEQELLTLFDSKVGAGLPDTDHTIIDLLASQAAQTPNAIALVFEDSVLTYGELDERSSQLASYLHRKGVTTNTLVPLCIERSLEMVVGILGILKAGCAYVPIDADYPRERIDYMLSDTGAGVVVSSEGCRDKLPASVQVISLDGDQALLSRADIATALPQPTSAQLLYVIYTSGSTGTPKGVMITHANLSDYLSGLKASLSIDRCRSFGLLSSIATDLGNTVLFSALAWGGCLHLFSKAAINDGDILADYFSTHDIDCIKIVPSHWKALSAERLLLPQQLLIFGGESLEVAVIDRIRSSGRRCTVVNHYGPTETTIGKLLHVVTDRDTYQHYVPIGKPFSDTKIYILNGSSQWCAAGVPGELYIGGAGVARGYLNNQVLTDERFIADPFSPGSGAKLYRTGDLVKYSPEGDIVFLGRSDDQVKIRGYRVEPGEISRILNECSLVDQGLVVVKGDNSDSKRLIGYVIPQGDFDRDGIISYLRAIVPEYMVPSLLISITKFPLLANGKIDKRGLPDPDSIDSPTGYIAPQTFLEKELAKIWSVLLEVETIGINDDFFSLGGHSLLAIRLISLIRKQLGVEVVIGDIFDYPTIATLSRQLTLHAGISVVPAIVPAQRPLHIPLSYSQERLWFIDQLEGSVQYHVPVVLRLNGSLHKNALTYALQTIINRHEVLRTVIVQEAGIAYQQLKEKDKWELTVIDNDVFREDEALLQSYIESLITAPFDLSQDYMLRAHLVILGIKEHVLVITLHHIASDGWSTSIIVRELAELYGSYTEARAAALPSLDIQYIDYAIWQRNYLTGPLLVEKLNYWKEKLTGVSMLQLPADYVRPAVQSSRGASSRLLLDKVLSDQLQVLSLQQGATLFMTLLAAFKVLLYRYSGQEDICVGSPTAGRTQQETEGLIGFFVNTLALRSDLGNDPSFISLLQQVKQTTLGAYMHQEVPFEKVVEAVVKNRDMSMHPLFQVLFVMQNVPGIPELRLGTVQLSVAPFEHTTSQFDLTIALAEGPDGLYGSIEYCTDLFSAATINRMIIHFEELLRSIVKSPEIPISALSMLPPDEMHQLLVSQNNTAVDYPQDQVITDLFALQVKRAPGAIAAVFEVSQLTYRELDERSNQLAHYLHNKGVGAETLVPICIDRSLEMIIGIMGILKAGGAYVPIDPEYPLDRIAFMLSDINAALLLTNAAHADQLKSVAGLAEIISLDEQWHYIAQEPLSPVDIVIASHHLAYVIYTSGSTGIPKGVMNEHGGVINRLQWAQDYFNLHSSDVILQKTTFCFDVSVWELLWPLITGARLVFALPDGHKDAGYLKAMIAQHKVTTIHFVPSMLTVFLESISSGDGADLRRVICSGEALAPQQVPAFRDKLPAAELYNLYGPTEAAIDVSYWHASRDINDISIVPIGKPISNTRLYILDKRGNVVPTGVTGELYIGGIQVARGYLNRLELTEEKFIVDPFSLDVTEKMYRTGDLCKWLPDGNIAYVGRVDHQVKVRGYRIELGEIENVLLECKLVSEVVVLANVVNNAVHLPDTRLVAYIVPNGQFDKAGIIAYLKDKLPEYMIPVSFTEIGAIPLTANGKIDRRALPDPGNQALSLHEYVAPASAMEQLLADIWQQLLGLERVGLHDNFFELGGHSLLAMRLISIIRETFNVEMSVKFFFQLPTIESQARHITISRNDSTSHHTDTKIIKL